MTAPVVSLAALQRACVNVSAPLHSEQAATRATVLTMVRSLRDPEATHALGRALVWRLAEASAPGNDRFGCWALIQGVIGEIQNGECGELAAILVDSVCRSIPDLIRTSWEERHLHPADPALASQYEKLAAAWTVGNVFSPRLVKRISAALVEAKRGLVSTSGFPHLVVPSEALKDALWKLRREDPRPVIARRLYKLWGGGSAFPKTEADIAKLPHVLHQRLKQWLQRLLTSPGCPRCDTFYHSEEDCPCVRPVQPVGLNDAVRILSAVVSAPSAPSVLEVLDVIVRLMTASKPFGQILSAFDSVRQSRTTPSEQSALFVLSTYSLTPSKLRADGKSLVLSDAVKHHFQKLGRYEELQLLNESLQCLRTAFFAYEEAEEPEKEFERWVDDLKKERLMLFMYFANSAFVELPTINGWDRRLRRIGAHCSKLCRNCLSTTHCSQECQAQADYDHRAATDALMYHRLLDDKPELLKVSRVLDCADAERERHPLEAHKLQMAAKLLFPSGSAAPPPYCTHCAVFHHAAASCRALAEAALRSRAVWPTKVISVSLFPHEVENQLRTEQGSDLNRALLTYGRHTSFPSDFAEAMLALAADNEVLPPAARRNRTEAATGAFFPPATLCFHTDLVESILIDSGRPGLVLALQAFRNPTFPEPCVLCGTVAHTTIRCGRCPDEVRSLLRLLYRQGLTLQDVVTRSTAAATQFAENFAGSAGLSMVLEEVRRLERECRSLVTNGNHPVAGSSGSFLKMAAPLLTKTLPAAHATQSDSNSDEHAAHGNGPAADDDEPPRKAARFESMDGFAGEETSWSIKQ